MNRTCRVRPTLDSGGIVAELKPAGGVGPSGRIVACAALAGVLILAPLACGPEAAARPGTVAPEGGPGALSAVPDTLFAGLVQRLSEPSGYFDTDNLISNESSYLHPIPRLRSLGVSGGAFVGVGPDQSFAYMAAIRPEIAFIVDIRRDNLLHHLLFKALFERSNTRVEFLSALYGRPAPEDPQAWMESDAEGVIAWVDGQEALDPQILLRDVRERIQKYGIPLDSLDLATVARFHETFMAAGLDLRFTSYGRAPRPYYPTHRGLLLETDIEGEQGSFIATEEAYRFIRDLERAHRVIPVVGNLAGDHALSAIGEAVSEMGLVVSALYTSNVEFYLWGDRTFPTFARTVSSLPHDGRTVIIRSVFGGGFRANAVPMEPGYASAQLLQLLDDFAERWEAGGIRSYGALVSEGSLDLRN